MRRLKSWLDGYMQYTEDTGSPTMFRRWAGLFTLAAALERKVWIKTKKGVLYPNLYIFLVSPPGAGKTLATSLSHELLTELDDHHIASTSVTKAALMDELVGAERKIVRPQDNPPISTFNSLAILSNELGTLIPGYESDFMNVLTDVYDCRIYSEARRTKDLRSKMPNPQLNLIAATTPSYLNNLLPEGAWDQGFLSRTLLVYAGALPPGDLFEDEVVNDDLYRKALVEDLKQIGNLYGKMSFEADAAEAITAWHKAGGPPAPDHPKLTHYNTRRTAHLLKLCMAISASTTNERVITLDHYAEALDLFLHMEASIPDIFKSMTSGGDGKVMQEAWHFAYEFWMKDQKPIREHLMVEFLANKTPSHNVAKMLDVMIKWKLLEEVLEPGAGRCFRPKSPKKAA